MNNTNTSITSLPETKTSGKNTGIAEISANVKNDLLQVMKNNNIIFQEGIDEIKTIKDAERFLFNLYKDQILTKNRYLQVMFEAGRIRLGEYLLEKGFINNIDLKKALDIQLNQKEKQNLGEILYDIKSIDFATLSSTLEELGIMRIGEYFLKENKISHAQLRMYIIRQKRKGMTFGEVLVENKIVTKKQLVEILNSLGIKTTINDYDLEPINDIYALQEKE